MQPLQKKGTRISLGCRDLSEIDKEFILTYGKRVTWFDLSNNRFSDDLLVLRSFPVLEVLILDANLLTSHLQLPPLPYLHTLWVNNNQIDNTLVLLDHLVQVTPNLEDLSLLKNPACLNYFSGGSPTEYRDYRLYIINRMTNLRILDGVPITKEELLDSNKLYGALPHTRTPKKEVPSPSASPRSESEEDHSKTTTTTTTTTPTPTPTTTPNTTMATTTATSTATAAATAAPTAATITTTPTSTPTPSTQKLKTQEKSSIISFLDKVTKAPSKEDHQKPLPLPLTPLAAVAAETDATKPRNPIFSIKVPDFSVKWKDLSDG